jgi:hypothetical protein
VCGFGDFGADDFVEGVDALALGRGGVHEMHFRGSPVVNSCVGYCSARVGLRYAQ